MHIPYIVPWSVALRCIAWDIALEVLQVSLLRLHTLYSTPWQPDIDNEIFNSFFHQLLLNPQRYLHQYFPRFSAVLLYYVSQPTMSLYVFFTFSGSLVHAICYYPDKSIVRNYQACKPEQGNGTACCELSSSVCTTTGYCIGNAGFLYRGGCTDRDWASPNCAIVCLNSTWTLFKTCRTDLNRNSIVS